MADNNVTVWTMRVDAPSAAALQRWHAVLDTREKTQAARFHADRDRHTYIAAHALTRALLAEVGGRPPADWHIIETETGKPQLAEGGVHFNLSHTAGFVACAAALHAPLGIDTEARDRKQKQGDLAETVLAPSEHAFLQSVPAHQRAEYFLRFWTLREAYVKATGQGINFPREDFAFTLNPPVIQFHGGSAESWQFFTWDEDRHIVSLALNGARAASLVKRQLTESDLP